MITEALKDRQKRKVQRIKQRWEMIKAAEVDKGVEQGYKESKYIFRALKGIQTYLQGIKRRDQ